MHDLRLAPRSWETKSLSQAQEKEASRVKIKREKADENPRPRKISRPSAGDTQFEIGDDGGFRQASTSTLAPDEKVVIELDEIDSMIS